MLLLYLITVLVILIVIISLSLSEIERSFLILHIKTFFTSIRIDPPLYLFLFQMQLVCGYLNQNKQVGLDAQRY